MRHRRVVVALGSKAARLQELAVAAHGKARTYRLARECGSGLVPPCTGGQHGFGHIMQQTEATEQHEQSARAALGDCQFDAHQSLPADC